MHYIYQWFENNFNLDENLTNKIISTLLIVIFLFLIQKLILKIAHDRVQEHASRYIWQKLLAYITVALVIIFIGRIWLKDYKDLSTILGFLTAGLVIALKDLIVDITGWFLIIWRKPLHLGDRIQIGEHKGDVVDIRLFQFSILEIGNWVDAEQFTGRIVHIPNGKIFTDLIFNYNRGFKFIWDEIPVLITNESDWKKAKNILQKITEKHTSHNVEKVKEDLSETSKKFFINIASLDPTVHTKIEPFGTSLTLRYLCLPHERRTTHELISEAILEEFAKHDDIDFAYPTHRIYSNLLEGKGVKKSDSGSIQLAFSNPFSRK